MRIALLSYRSKAHCGGQGVYVRHLSAGLAELGHEVEVLSGPPYPEDLDPRVRLSQVPSLDLFADPAGVHFPSLRTLRSRADWIEYLVTLTGCFAEPWAFSVRAARILRERRDEFDVAHDNQSLGYGLLSVLRQRIPLVVTIHHPITRDVALELAAAPSWRRRLSIRQWYRFVGMQARVARRMPLVLGVASTSLRDAVDDFGLDPARTRVVPLGVDTAMFAPGGQRVRGRIVAVASADRPLKGVVHLLEAFAKVRTAHDVELCLVSTLDPAGPSARRIAELGIEDAVRTFSHITDEELAALLASAEVMCVPSLYEGFSLPTVEAMACGTPLVATRAGAVPEVVGEDGTCALLVEPGDSEALAGALLRLLESPELRERLGAAGRARAEQRFSWVAVARSTAQVYREAIADAHR
ncbi:MAG TPA: glycosyltransferase family 4 protein [Candidatus Nanopelagicales bacterium]